MGSAPFQMKDIEMAIMKSMTIVKHGDFLVPNAPPPTPVTYRSDDEDDVEEEELVAGVYDYKVLIDDDDSNESEKKTIKKKDAAKDRPSECHASNSTLIAVAANISADTAVSTDVVNDNDAVAEQNENFLRNQITEKTIIPKGFDNDSSEANQ